jgi:hypothetical protein
MIKRSLFTVITLCALVLTTTSSTAQYYFYNDKYYGNDWIVEMGGSAGIMNSLTDLGGRKGTGKDFLTDLNLKVSKPSYSLYIIGMYRGYLGIRLEGTFGKLESYDSILKKRDPNLIGRYGRNLSFRTNITDVHLAFEIHPLFFKYYNEDKAPYFSPYLVAGIGYFSFNPQAYLNGRWHDLQPLHLEGQGFAEYPGRKNYKLNQFNIPLGVGLRYEINSYLFTRFEVLYRKLFTDYLDDVSTNYADPSLFSAYLQPSQAAIAQQLYSRMQELQPGHVVSPGEFRGDKKDKDAYFTVQLKIGVVLPTERRK